MFNDVRGVLKIPSPHKRLPAAQYLFNDKLFRRLYGYVDTSPHTSQVTFYLTHTKYYLQIIAAEYRKKKREERRTIV